MQATGATDRPLTLSRAQRILQIGWKRAIMESELDKQIQQAADILRSFGAKEVYVFGSAAHGEADDRSDVDLAVVGLTSAVFLKAWARAVRSLPGREMDLVDLDRDEPFAQFLREHGELKRVG